MERNLQKKGRGIALLPFLLFIAIYLGAGLYLQAKGTDLDAWHVVVTDQSIPAETEVDRGTTITVIFADTTDMD